jgi:hypothetical protein
VLCRGCNQGLGFLRDSPDRLRAAAVYLERGGSPESLKAQAVAEYAAFKAVGDRYDVVRARPGYIAVLAKLERIANA